MCGLCDDIINYVNRMTSQKNLWTCNIWSLINWLRLFMWKPCKDLYSGIICNRHLIILLVKQVGRYQILSTLGLGARALFEAQFFSFLPQKYQFPGLAPFPILWNFLKKFHLYLITSQKYSYHKAAHPIFSQTFNPDRISSCCVHY